MKTCRFAILAVLLLESAVSAQPGPIYFVEHDWSFCVAGSRFGLCQDKLLGDEKYGAGRHTTLYFGGASFRTSTRSFQRATFIALPLGAVALCTLYVLMRRSKRVHANELKN
jgi:hypothetical protein